MAAQVAIVTNRKRPATCLEVHGHVIASIYLFRNNNGSAHPEYANRVRRFGPFRWLLLMDFDKQYRMNYRVYAKYRYVYNYVKSESNTCCSVICIRRALELNAKVYSFLERLILE